MQRKIFFGVLAIIIGIVITNLIVLNNEELYGVGSLCTGLSFIGGIIVAAFTPNPEDSNEKTS